MKKQDVLDLLTPYSNDRNTALGAWLSGVGEAVMVVPHESLPLGNPFREIGTVLEMALGLPENLPDAADRGVREKTTRSTTGAHYTPDDMLEDIVRPATGAWFQTQWEHCGGCLVAYRDALVGIRVCDPAMGSGHFLVVAAREVAAEIAWATLYGGPRHVSVPDIHTHPEAHPWHGGRYDELIRGMAGEIGRVVAECMYGVDVNPLALSAATLTLRMYASLVQRLGGHEGVRAPDGLPNLRCGDALLWLTRDIAEQILKKTLGITKESPDNPFFAGAPWDDRTPRDLALLATFVGATPRPGKDGPLRALISQHMQAPAELDRLNWEAIVGDNVNAVDAGLQDARAAIVRAAATAPLVGDRALRAFHWDLEFPSVFDPAHHPGFDVIVANPPFLGGKKQSGPFGKPYREMLVSHVAGGIRGNADLSAYFARQFHRLLAACGAIGMVATNSIAQGDTREVGLDAICDQQSISPLQMFRANPSQKWPGDANITVAHVWLYAGRWPSIHWLVDSSATDASTTTTWMQVRGITPYLLEVGKMNQNPVRLLCNIGRSFQGSIILGSGFILSPDDAKMMLATSSSYLEVVKQYLIGDDLTKSPSQSPSRYVIDFGNIPWMRDDRLPSWSSSDRRTRENMARVGIVSADYPDRVATDYADPAQHVAANVKPERTRTRPDGTFQLRSPLFLRWWHYAAKRPELYRQLEPLSRAVYAPRVSKYGLFVMLPTAAVSSEGTVVIPDERFATLGILQSSIHDLWTAKYQSSLRNDRRYTPSDCFETFPFPEESRWGTLEALSEAYHTHRANLMILRNEGLTKTYNRFHNAADTAGDIAQLRTLHQQLDLAVLSAYGWSDLDPVHDFYPTKAGERFTFHPDAAKEVLQRLLVLNLEMAGRERGSAATCLVPNYPS